MRGQEHILRDQFAQFICATCGATHRPDDMHVLAQRGSRWLLLLTCWQCQHRGIFVASFPRAEADAKSPEPPAVTNAPTIFPPTSTAPWQMPYSTSPHTDDTPGAISPYPNPSSSAHDSAVTSGDVDSIRHFLEGFDGDFHTLFGPSNGMARG